MRSRSQVRSKPLLRATQPERRPGPWHARPREKLFADLNLTDDQKAQIKKIHQEAKAKADAVMGDSSLSDADKKTKVREIHKSAMMESKKVLTAEQRAQLKEKMKERRAAKSRPLLPESKRRLGRVAADAAPSCTSLLSGEGPFGIPKQNQDLLFCFSCDSRSAFFV
jgi:hypothetical protein